jgi:hypothetical protein
VIKAKEVSTARAWCLFASSVLVMFVIACTKPAPEKVVDAASDAADCGAACPEEIRLATYNILGSHFLQDGSPICMDLVGAACTELRAGNFMRIVRGYAGFGAFDVVGVQEMERDQFIQIGSGLSGVDPAYASEPIKYDRHPIALDPNYLTQNIDDYGPLCANVA